MSRHLLLIIMATCQLTLSPALPSNGKTPQQERPTSLAKISAGPSLPSGRGSHAGAKIGGRIVVAGGTSWSDDRTKKSFLADTLIFDDKAWKPGPSLPHAVAEGAFAADADHLYLIGGLSEVDKAFADVFELSFDGSSQLRVKSMSPLPLAQYGGAATVLDWRLYVAGGFVGGQATNRCWSLDLSRPDQWVEINSLPTEARAYPALLAAANKLYLLGGMVPVKESMRVFKDVFEYDASSDHWRKFGELPVSGYCWSAVPTDISGNVLVGGRADGQIHDDLWLLDLLSLSARSIGSSVITTTCAPLVRLGPSKYWLIGGEPNSNMSRTPLVTEIELESSSN